MSLTERDKIILIIIFSLVGLISILLSLCYLIWRLIHCYHLKKTKFVNNPPKEYYSRPISSYHRPQYQRKFDNNNNYHQNRRIKRNKRSNTADSAITLSFDPPHLINQNVKNLEKFLQNESTLTANSWFYEETLPKKICYGTNSSKEPIYTSSSTVLTSLSTLAVPHNQGQFLHELDHVLRVKHPLKHSQSCRQTTDFLPFDYQRSTSSPSTTTTTETNSSANNSLEPIYIRTNKSSNATLLRKVKLAQIRDDTAILY